MVTPKQLIAIGAVLFLISGVLTCLFGGRSLAADLTTTTAAFFAMVGLANLYDTPQRPKRERHNWQVPHSMNGQPH